MKSVFPLLKESSQILHTCFGFIVSMFMVDMLSEVVVDNGWIFLLFVLIPIKILISAGVFGTLVEIASTEEYLIKFDHFLENAKKFWKIYAGLLVGVLVVHFLFTLLVPGLAGQPFSITLAHFNLFILFVMAIFIFVQKYLRPLQINSKKVKIRGGDFIVVLVFLSVDLFLFYLPKIISADVPLLFNVSAFFSHYFHLFEFLFISLLILNQYPEIENQFNPKHEIFLINPISAGLMVGIGSLFFPSKPAFFVVLKAFSPKYYKFREFNRVLWRDRYYKSNKLVAITSFTSNAAEAYKMAKEFKRHGSKVVMGGPHVTYLPEEALKYCDSVVVGEVEGVWEQIVSDFERGDLKHKYSGGRVANYHERVHQELLNSSPDVIKDFLETTRGCKFKCHFCAVPTLSEGGIRKKPVFELVELLEKVRPKYSKVTFIDNNIYNDPAYARELFQALKPLKMKWRTFCTIDIAKNTEMLQLAKESGCDELLLGYEISGNSGEDSLGGKLSMVEKYKIFSKNLHNAGIKIRANFIYGWPTDNFQSLLNLWKFCLEIKPYCSCLSFLTPLPGTELYHSSIKQNNLINMNWRRYDCYDLVVKHKNLENSWLERIFYPTIPLLLLLTTAKIGRILLGVIFVTMLFYFIFMNN